MNEGCLGRGFVRNWRRTIENLSFFAGQQLNEDVGKIIGNLIRKNILEFSICIHQTHRESDDLQILLFRTKNNAPHAIIKK